MTGRRRSARSSTHDAKESIKAAESTHLATKDGKPHKDVVQTTEAAHGPNRADRMDTVDQHHTEVLPQAEHNTIPLARRIDEGQNRGNE